MPPQGGIIVRWIDGNIQSSRQAGFGSSDGRSCGFRSLSFDALCVPPSQLIRPLSRDRTGSLLVCTPPFIPACPGLIPAWVAVCVDVIPHCLYTEVG